MITSVYHNMDYTHPESSEKFCVEFDAIVKITTFLYGADADGNRGEMRTEMEIEPKVLAVTSYEPKPNSELVLEESEDWEDVLPGIAEAMEKHVRDNFRKE